MNKLLYQFFTKDHRRIEDILNIATEDIHYQMDYYHQFRSGLLKHIKMEERIFFPAAQKANNGVPLPLAAKLRLDHGALTALMVVPPDPEVVKVLRYVLEEHDRPACHDDDDVQQQREGEETGRGKLRLKPSRTRFVLLGVHGAT